MPYKMLEGDPAADLPISQKSELDKALADASNHLPVAVNGVLGRKGYIQLSAIVRKHQVK